MYRMYWIGLGVALCLSVVFVMSTYSAAPSYARITFLDVGQGDAILVESPSGARMLIDAGRNRQVLRSLAGVFPYGERDIDVVVMTHPDADHVGGMESVFERFTVSHVVGMNAHSETLLFERMQEDIQTEGARVYNAERGMVIDLGAGLYAQVLFPHENMTINGNDASVSMKITYGKIDVVLTGDAGVGVEEYLVAIDGETLEAEILKVGHHGSKTSTSKIFLEAVRAERAIISAGKDNSYGHPHADVLRALSSASVPYLETAQEGSITFVTNGENVWRE